MEFLIGLQDLAEFYDSFKGAVSAVQSLAFFNVITTVLLVVVVWQLLAVKRVLKGQEEMALIEGLRGRVLRSVKRALDDDSPDAK